MSISRQGEISFGCPPVFFLYPVVWGGMGNGAINEAGIKTPVHLLSTEKGKAEGTGTPGTESSGDPSLGGWEKPFLWADPPILGPGSSSLLPLQH